LTTDFAITVYKSLRDGKWRWRLRSRNGRTVADSGEGYSGHKRCVMIVERIFGERWPVEVTEGK